MKHQSQAIVLFDGVCNFCDKSVQFIIKRDPVGYFSFAPLQGSTAAELMLQHHMKEAPNSFVLVEGGRVYLRSTAALRMCRNLRGAWKLMSIFLVVPAPLRDLVYTFIANNRYKWFGKKDSCMLPTPEQRQRFLD